MVCQTWSTPITKQSNSAEDIALWADEYIAELHVDKEQAEGRIKELEEMLNGSPSTEAVPYNDNAR